MGRKCLICASDRRQAIDAAIVAGASYRRLSTRYDNISEASIRRHARSHVPKALAEAHGAAEAARGDDLLAQVRSLHAKTLSVLDAAEAAGKTQVMLAAVREARSNLELLARLLGELERRDVAVEVNVTGAGAPSEEAVRAKAMDLLAALINALPSPLKSAVADLLMMEFRERRRQKLDAATAKMMALMPPRDDA